MTNLCNKIDCLEANTLLKVVKITLANILNLLASHFSLSKPFSTKMFYKVRVIIAGAVFLVFTSLGVFAQSLPMITIEANPFKDSDTEGHSYILVVNKDLTEDLVVKYEVVPDTGSPISKMATIKPVPNHANVNFTEFRVNVTESHTEVRLVVGENVEYMVGTPASAMKIDQPIETTETTPGVQIKFRQNTVNEGANATLVVRLTPYPENITFVRLDFLFKINDGEFISVAGFNDTSKIDPYIFLGPVTGFNMAYEFNEVSYFFKDSDYDLNDVTINVNIQYNNRFSKRVTNVTRLSSNDQASIQVINDDTEKFVRIETDTEMIEKGGSFPVTVTASRPPPGEEIEVELGHNDSGSGYFGSFEPNENQITLTNMEPSKTIMVNTEELMGPQGDGKIEISIVENSNYTIDTGKGQVSVNITDPDAIKVSIETLAVNQTITEGQEAVFKIKINDENPDTSIDLDINLFITNDTSENFFTWRVPKSVRLAEEMTEKEFSIRTGTRANSNGSFSVTIAKGFGYRAVSPLSAQVNVTADPDDVTTEDRTSVADLAVANILSVINSPTPPATNQTEATNLPIISIISETDSIEEGHPIVFTLISQSVVPFQLRIGISINGPNSLIGTETARTVFLEANQSQTKFTIPTTDNYRAEEENRLVSVTINPNTKYRIGNNSAATVNITDHEDRARRRNELEQANHEVLSELYQNIGVSSWSNLSNQIGFALAGNKESSIILGGQDTINGILTANATALEEETWSFYSLLENSSFNLNLEPDSYGNSLGTIWGISQQQELSRTENNIENSWEGDILTAQFGTDLQLNENGIAGISISVSDSAIEYGNGQSDAIQYDFQNNYMQSYLGWQFPNQNAELHLAAGYGVGEINLNQDDYYPLHLISNMQSLAASGNVLLYSSPKSSNRLSNTVSLVGDSYLAQIDITDTDNFLNDQQFGFSWTQIGIETTNLLNLKPNKSLQMNTSFNSRSQFEDQETSMGLITQSDITYTDQSGLSVSGTGQFLFNNDQHFVNSVGIQGNFNFDSNYDNLGSLIRMTPAWNFNKQDSFGQLLDNKMSDQNVSNLIHNNAKTSLYSEVGYGISLPDNSSTLTPYSSFELQSTGNQNYRIGSKFKFGQGISLKIENSYKLQENKNDENKVKLSGQVQW